jgi:hypothetical protein
VRCVTHPWCEVCRCREIRRRKDKICVSREELKAFARLAGLSFTHSRRLLGALRAARLPKGCVAREWMSRSAASEKGAAKNHRATWLTDWLVGAQVRSERTRTPLRSARSHMHSHHSPAESDI